jgi:tetratricopeptide (TPR) repeat protein
VGKTALVLHWAHRVAHLFPGGQLFVDMRGYAPGPPMRPMEALEVLLRSLGTRPEQVPVNVAEAAAMYRSSLAGKRVLLVLDDARSAEDVRPLLPGGPGCLVLVTTRNRLTGLVARDGARCLDLDVFTPQEAGTLLARLLGADRVHAEPEAVAELAGLCAHLPLALRIAAAILAHRPYRPVADLVSELRTANQIGALTADDDTAIEAAFDLSYQAVPPAAQRLFRLLGLIPGDDFSVAAAATLSDTGPAEVRPLLDRLAAAHLVEERARDRFAFHGLLRRYAADRAMAQHTAAERDAALGRLFAWYLAEVDGAAREVYPQVVRLSGPAGDRFDPVPAGIVSPVGRTRKLAWLDAERRNLLAAVHHAAEHGPRSVAWLLTDWLRGYFWRRGGMAEWSGAGSVALAAAETAGDLTGQAAMRHTQALLHIGLGNHGEGATHLTAAIDQAARAGWSEGLIPMMGNLGSLYLEVGQTGRSIDLYRQALDLARDHQNPMSQAIALNNLGYSYRITGHLQEALAHLTPAVAGFRATGGLAAEANGLYSLATTYHDLGRFAEALDHGTRSLAQYREVGHPERAARVSATLALIMADLGRHGDALQLAEESLLLTRQIGERRAETYALNAVAAAHAAQGDAGEAARRYEQVRHGMDTAPQPYPRVVATIGLAWAYPRLGRHDAAIDCAQEARHAASGHGFAVLEGRAVAALADALACAGRLPEAAAHAQTALELHRRSGHRLGEAYTLALLGRLREGEDGARLRQRARNLYVEIGVPVPPECNRPPFIRENNYAPI